MVTSFFQYEGIVPEEEEIVDPSAEKELTIASLTGDKIEIIAPVNSPSLDFNDNEDIPTELSDSSETHDEGVWLVFRADLVGLPSPVVAVQSHDSLWPFFQTEGLTISTT